MWLFSRVLQNFDYAKMAPNGNCKLNHIETKNRERTVVKGLPFFTITSIFKYLLKPRLKMNIKVGYCTCSSDLCNIVTWKILPSPDRIT